MNKQEIANNQSKTCSNVCRQIIFALAAISWGFIYINDAIDKNVFPIVALITIIIYLSLDITQYLYSYIKIRKISILLFIANIHNRE
ncbi:hypothetical protein [Macellibacteroides fermentans]|jgi:hypothetical protein|uniref:hypothetical protein n=1 Tax=Macellibacteroides fermentans TaxID=879969 RepID=UPI00406C64A2